MYEQDYEKENNEISIERHNQDDTLYVLKQILDKFYTNDNNDPKNKRILDLGSGDCHYHKYFDNYQFIGLDKNIKIHKGKENIDVLINQDI